MRSFDAKVDGGFEAIYLQRDLARPPNVLRWRYFGVSVVLRL
jgi:hypothetical protein